MADVEAWELEYIDDYSPAIVLSGHVHEDYGLVRIGESLSEPIKLWWRR